MATTTATTTTTTTSTVAPGTVSTTTPVQAGLMHSIKQTLMHGQKHTDSDYDATAAHFNALHAQIVQLRASASNYVSSVHSVFLNGNNVSVEFANILLDGSADNPYAPLAQQFRVAHNRLNSEKQQAVAAQLTEQVIRPLDEQLRVMIPLQQRITKRNELHHQLEYYINKMHTLNKERDERGAKGKAEKPAAIEKHERNTVKLETARQNYTVYAAALMADLNNAWLARIATLGPALASFIEGEKRFMQIMNEELSAPMDQSVGLVQPPPAAFHQPLTATDIPAPVLAGDVQLAPVSVAAASVTSVPVTTTTTVEKTVSASHLDREGLVHLDQAPVTSHHTTSVTENVPVPAGTFRNTSEGSNPFDSPIAPVASAPLTTTSSTEGAHIQEANILDLPQQPITETTTTQTTLMQPASVVDSYGFDGVNSAVSAPMASMSALPSTASAASFTPAITLKSQGEEESKRQRFENDQKNAPIVL